MPTLLQLQIMWRGLTPTLLRYDGTEFSGGTVIKSLLVDHDKKYPEVTIYADNARGFSEIGNPQGWMDGFTLEAFSPTAVRQIKNSIASEASRGIFILEIPEFGGSVTRHAVRFFDAPFERLYPRREGFVEVFSAAITEVDVLSSSSTAA